MQNHKPDASRCPLPSQISQQGTFFSDNLEDLYCLDPPYYTDIIESASSYMYSFWEKTAFDLESLSTRTAALWKKKSLTFVLQQTL